MIVMVKYMLAMLRHDLEELENKKYELDDKRTLAKINTEINECRNAISRLEKGGI